MRALLNRLEEGRGVPTTDEINRFVSRLHRFEAGGVPRGSSSVVTFATRDDADMDRYRPGPGDLKTVKRVQKAVEDHFGDAVKTRIDFSEEWTELEVRIVGKQ